MQFKTDPWFDIRQYGAKCDGSTDDTAAIQAAIDAAHAANVGATVFVPGTATYTSCVFTTPLTVYGGITLTGPAGPQVNSPALKYTGTSSPAITGGSIIVNFRLQNIVILYTNPGFNGVLVSLTGDGSASWLDGVTLKSSSISQTTASYLLDLSNSNSNHIYRSHFGGTSKAINLNNVVLTTIDDSTFASIYGTISTTYVDNVGASISFSGDDFEFINEGTNSGPILNCPWGATGSVFSKNWIGDHSANWAGTLFQGCTGMAFIGNRLEGTTSTAKGTILNTGTHLGPVVWKSNVTVGSWSVAFKFGAALADVDISGNIWPSTANLTTFLSGPTPLSGTMMDNTANGGKNLIPAQAVAYISNGATFTSNSGCKESKLTGGATAGSFRVGQNTNCTVVITMGNSATAPHGWTCWAYDETGAPSQAIRQIAHSATGCSLNMTVATNDIIVFGGEGW